LQESSLDADLGLTQKFLGLTQQKYTKATVKNSYSGEQKMFHVTKHGMSRKNPKESDVKYMQIKKECDTSI